MRADEKSQGQVETGSVQQIRKRGAEVLRRFGIGTEKGASRGEKGRAEKAQGRALQLFLAGLSGGTLPASEIGR